MNIETPSRSQNFAKLLTYNETQVLVFLQRDNDEKLAVIVQLWSVTADMQVRALIDVTTDDEAIFAFDTLTDESIAGFIEISGLLAVIDG